MPLLNILMCNMLRPTVAARVLASSHVAKLSVVSIFNMRVAPNSSLARKFSILPVKLPGSKPSMLALQKMPRCKASAMRRIKQGVLKLSATPLHILRTVKTVIPAVSCYNICKPMRNLTILHYPGALRCLKQTSNTCALRRFKHENALRKLNCKVLKS